MERTVTLTRSEIAAIFERWNEDFKDTDTLGKRDPLAQADNLLTLADELGFGGE